MIPTLCIINETKLNQKLIKLISNKSAAKFEY